MSSPFLLFYQLFLIFLIPGCRLLASGWQAHQKPQPDTTTKQPKPLTSRFETFIRFACEATLA